MNTMLTNALLLIMIFCMIGVLLTRLHRIYLWFKSKYEKRKIYKSDKRKFDVSEVVWLNGHKFIITQYVVRSDNLDITIDLQPVEYSVSFKRIKVDSREVKKVVRTYAELGEVNE